MTSKPTCSPPSVRDSPGRWSRPASTSPARAAPPAAPLTMSWTPSPACQPCWSNCHECPRRHPEPASRLPASRRHLRGIALPSPAPRLAHSCPCLSSRGPLVHGHGGVRSAVVSACIAPELVLQPSPDPALHARSEEADGDYALDTITVRRTRE